MIEIAPIAWVAIACGGILSGFIDSIAGGGGLISLPVLLASGVPPLFAIGTNKVQSVFGSGTAAMRYSIKGLVPWRKIWPGVVMSFVGATAGAWTVSRINTELFEKILPFILLALLCYIAFKRDLGQKKIRARMHTGLFYPLAGSLFGFYDGFLGPGTGSFWTISQVSLVGIDLKQATTATKPSNFASNIGALLFFILSGQIIFNIGLVMAAGQLLGSWIGSQLVIKHPPRFIYPFFLIVVAATVMKLFWDQWAFFR